MSDNKWTPGPWIEYVGAVRSQSQKEERGKLMIESPVCSVVQVIGRGIQNKANARLIAAAPELYEALELMLQRYGYETCEYVQQALAALAKARGKAHKTKAARGEKA